MQTKSEMINRIAELAKEVEQWKHEYKVLDACCELAQGKIAELKQDIEAYKQSEQEATEIIAELKAENERLKSENETLNYQWHKRAEIGDEWYKLAEKYKVAFQEIKEIIKAEEPRLPEKFFAIAKLNCIEDKISEVME